MAVMKQQCSIHSGIQQVNGGLRNPMHKSFVVLFGFLGLFIFVVPFSRAEITLGGGMEYYTAKTQINDVDGRFYHSLVQGTLAIARLGYTHAPWYAALSAGLSDWNISGEWNGTGMGTFAGDDFYWGWQQKLEVEAGVILWGPISVGVNYCDRAFEHYEGLTHYQFMRSQSQSMSFLATWAFFNTPDLTLNASAVYAPAAYLSHVQSFYFAELDYVVEEYENTGRGPSWQGRLQMNYRDSAGWGLDVLYQFGWQEMAGTYPVQSMVIKTGSVQGCFLFCF